MVADKDIQRQINHIIASCCGQEDALITAGSWLDTDLYIDSLMLTDIAYALEDAFPVHITNDDMAGVNQVADVYQLVIRQLTAGKNTPS